MAGAARPALAGALIAFALCGLFVTAFHSPSPHAIPVATVGAATAPAGFDLRHYDNERAARADLASGDVRGVLLPGRLLVASARGSVEAQLLHAAFPRAAVVDVAPLPERDSRGLSVVFTALGVTVAAVAFGALLTRVGSRQRLLSIVLFAVATGLVVALTVDTIVGALTGAFWATAGIVALAAAAIGAATHALGRLLGPPGLALAALVFVPLGQSAAGGALGPDLVPGFFGALSDVLPVGAAQSALRGAVYFSSAGTTVPLLVLAAWAVGGAAALLLPLRTERT
jgi:hypothetical protein